MPYIELCRSTKLNGTIKRKTTVYSKSTASLLCFRPRTNPYPIKEDKIPAELRYVDSHEWLRREEDGTVTVGITFHAQELLGDIVFVELPEIGTKLAAKDQVGVVESVKAASDIYAPLAGEITAVNENLASAPETANSDPYGQGWFFKIKPDNPADYDSLLGAEQYAAIVG